MSGRLFDRYGAILQEDVDVLEACLREVINDIRGEKVDTGHMRAARVIEIGMHDGGTARGIHDFLNERGVQLSYVGIDPDDGTTRPRYVPPGGTVLVGDSAEVFNEVKSVSEDLVWVDGCHCRGHVILDTLNFHTKVRVGGFMLFHDINPAGQGKEHQYHGPEIPEFGLAIDAAHKLMHWPFDGWGMVLEKWPTDVLNCGTRAYRRIF